ncbi:MAG TPA: NAD-dependent epimerase/dehydratase family protein [Anaerolineales bacterium]|nr:NAD-dependent epimerase/dehydratase family protein [Anaerolineales bacterium]
MDIVTGSFGYIGKYITRRLLATGRQVRTITTHPNKPNPFGSQVQAFPYEFNRPSELLRSFDGVDTLYNTYWIRFPHDDQTFESALANTRVLFECARKAGVSKIVQISVTHASPRSDLPYYQGKGIQEKMLTDLDIPHVIVRPTLVFGQEDILVNNIAWLIRKFPIFPVFGDGNYRVQPVYVEDLAQIAVNLADAPSGTVVDAIGPEIHSFKDFLELIADTLSRRTRLIHVPASIGILMGKIIGPFVGDNILTKNELRGLMEEYLVSRNTPNGETRFSEWLQINRDTVGTVYTSEIGRHFDWKPGR